MLFQNSRWTICELNYSISRLWCGWGVERDARRPDCRRTTQEKIKWSVTLTHAGNPHSQRHSAPACIHIHQKSLSKLTHMTDLQTVNLSCHIRTHTNTVCGQPTRDLFLCGGCKGRDVTGKQMLATVATADTAKNNCGRTDRNSPHGHKRQANYMVWNEDQIHDESTGQERRGASGVVHSGARAGKSSATWQAKQTNKGEVKGGEVRGKSWHIPEVAACFSEVFDCSVNRPSVWLETECIHFLSQLHPTLKERGLPWVTVWHNVLRNVQVVLGDASIFEPRHVVHRVEWGVNLELLIWLRLLRIFNSLIFDPLMNQRFF